MKVWGAIFNLIAAALIVIMAAAYINMTEVMERDFNQERFNYAVQQATEAMFRQTLEAEDIDLDYQDMSYIQINASDCIEIFDRVMCANYDLSPSEENFSVINDCISACVIAGYDGYYTLKYSEDDFYENGVAADGYSPRFSIKIPYIVNNIDTTYAVDSYKRTNIGMKTNDYNSTPTLNVTGNTWPTGVDEAKVQDAINLQVRAAVLDSLIYTENVSVGNINELNFFFPDDTTVSGVNPFEAPGIFIVMNGSEFAGTDGLTSMSAAGYKVIKKIQIIAFTDTKTNRSYYCYEGQMSDFEKDSASGGLSANGSNFGDFHIENYFSSMKLAAEAVSPTTGEHYAPYYELLIRKASKVDSE